MSKREIYIAKVKLQLDDLNANLNEFEGKAKVATAEARDKYEEDVAKLRQHSDLAVAKLAELKAAGEDTWDSLVAEMEKLRDATSRSFHYFKSQL